MNFTFIYYSHIFKWQKGITNHRDFFHNRFSMLGSEARKLLKILIKTSYTTKDSISKIKIINTPKIDDPYM